MLASSAGGARSDPRSVANEIRIIHSSELDGWGYSSRRRREPATRALLVPLRAGLFALRENWDRASPEERVCASADAYARVAPRRRVFSHETAAALHGLPLLRPDPSRLHVTDATGRPGASKGVIRHRGALEPADVVTIRGLACTSLTRTVADVARTARFEAAVTVADAALRRLFVSAPHEYDEARAVEFLRETRVVSQRSAQGRRRADAVMAFADGRAQLPGESVSRVRLAQLGFARPRLQVAVPAPRRGASYYIDFGLDDAGASGEFDGRMKYVNGRLLVERSPDEVLDDEKQREDWIRGVTGRPLVRWGWPHISTPTVLGQRLRAFGIAPPS
jgi:hypothetical protein